MSLSTVIVMCYMSSGRHTHAFPTGQLKVLRGVCKRSKWLLTSTCVASGDLKHHRIRNKGGLGLKVGMGASSSLHFAYFSYKAQQYFFFPSAPHVDCVRAFASLDSLDSGKSAISYLQVGGSEAVVKS